MTYLGKVYDYPKAREEREIDDASSGGELSGEGSIETGVNERG